MQDKVYEDRWNEQARKPFQPLNPNTQSSKTEDRAAHALEYIAAQLGFINAKLDSLLAQEGTSTDRN